MVGRCGLNMPEKLIEIKNYSKTKSRLVAIRDFAENIVTDHERYDTFTTIHSAS